MSSLVSIIWILTILSFIKGNQTNCRCSLGAETRTPKNSPHKCLIQILILSDIINQKLNDATLASLGIFKMASKMAAKGIESSISS